MVIDHSANVDTITKVVQTHVSEAKLDRSNGKELAYTLPVAAVSNFAGRYGPRLCLPKQDQIHSCLIRLPFLIRIAKHLYMSIYQCNELYIYV